MRGKTLSMLLLTLSGLGWMISRGASAATPQPTPEPQPWTGGNWDQWDDFGSPWGSQYPSNPTTPQPQPTGPDMGNEPRGIRNHNPGNIRHGDNWQGMAAVQTDPEYIQFTGPEWGIRAAGKLLLNYERLYGLNTVRAIINRWAPAVENNTSAYVSSVANRLGVSADQPLSVLGVLPELVKAIIYHENGKQPYSDTTIQAGLALI